jgi:hypothetical protein
LANYGPIGVFLKNAVAPLRVSLLIENSYAFLKKYYKFGQSLPEGYQATWVDRGRLAVIKHAADITPATRDDSIGDLILRPGATRDDDNFIEVYIYDGFDKRAVERVILNRPLMKPRERMRWQN